MAEAIWSLTPDTIVLTEFVPGPSRKGFFAELASFGLIHRSVSQYTQKQNHVLIASRYTLNAGAIQAPAIASALPSNVLHVLQADVGLEILGLRVPDYSKQPHIKRKCWDWIIKTVADFKDRPFVMLGDFNTDPNYSKAKCGDCISKLLAEGWQHAAPTEGASFWSPRGHPVRIDHAFVSKHFSIQNARYVDVFDRYVFAGRGRRALSDHAVLVVDIALVGGQTKQ